MARTKKGTIPKPQVSVPEFGGADHAPPDNLALGVSLAALGGHTSDEIHPMSAAQQCDGRDHAFSVTQYQRVPTVPQEGGGQSAIETPAPDAAPSLLNIYVSTYEAHQKLRMETMNRLRCWLRDTVPREEWPNRDFSDEAIETALSLPNNLNNIAVRLRMSEHDARLGLAREIKTHSLWSWLGEVRGIGPTLAARLLHRLGDLHRFPTVAALWRYCGLDGPHWREKNELGQYHYSPRLLAVLWNIMESFQRQVEGTYPDRYRARKAYEQGRPWCGSCHHTDETEDRETCTAGHINNKARRYAVKAFLKDLWIESRRLRQTESLAEVAGDE